MATTSSPELKKRVRVSLLPPILHRVDINDESESESDSDETEMEQITLPEKITSSISESPAFLPKVQGEYHIANAWNQEQEAGQRKKRYSVGKKTLKVTCSYYL